MSTIGTELGRFGRELIEPVTGLISEFITDKDEAQKLAFRISTMAERHRHEESIAQMEVNKQEAKHPSVWVAGWRPAVGWVSVFSLAFNGMGVPFLNFAAAVYGSDATVAGVDMTEALFLLGAMLGVSIPRTLEKRAGVARENLAATP